MPGLLDRCVKKLVAKGKKKKNAFGICAASTGWVRGPNGTWVKKKNKSKKISQ